MANYIGIAKNLDVLKRSYFRSEEICVLLEGEGSSYRRVQCVPKSVKRFHVVVDRLKSGEELEKKDLDPKLHYVFVCDFKVPECYSNPRIHLIENKDDLRARVHINIKRGVGSVAKITFPPVQKEQVVKVGNIVMAEPNMVVSPAKSEPKPEPVKVVIPQPVAKAAPQPVEEPKK